MGVRFFATKVRHAKIGGQDLLETLALVHPEQKSQSPDQAFLQIPKPGPRCFKLRGFGAVPSDRLICAQICLKLLDY